MKDLEQIKEFLKIFCIKIYQNKTKQFSDYFNYLWKYEIICGHYDMTIDFNIIIKSWNEFGTLQNKFKKGKNTNSHPVC